MNVGWAGLGRMGYPMAERVLRAGTRPDCLEPDAIEGGAAAGKDGCQDRGRLGPLRGRHSVHDGIGRR